MEGKKLGAGDAREVLRIRASCAEEARWQYAHGRSWRDGSPDTGLAGAASLALGREMALLEVYFLFASRGVIDADEADRIVAETRAATRAELDAKWLKPAEPAEPVPPLLEWSDTYSGFRRADFLDLYDELCALEESEAWKEDAVGLGISKGHSVMFLGRNLVRAILPALQHFAETGRLPGSGTEAECAPAAEPRPLDEDDD